MTNVLNHEIPVEKYFEEISRIPRGSGNEAGIAAYLVRFAQEHGLRFYQDDLHNVVIYKPGSPGYEAEPPVILQAHIDMVCVKEPWSSHDFLKDPIELVLEGNILHANGTSLGADNGTGVATMLALLSQDIASPPIEALFTASEETGMYGAIGFDYSKLSGRRLIGLDSGGENRSSVNAAACETVALKLPVQRERLFAPVNRLYISGLLGGHSGSCIDMERVNAIKIAAGLLRKCMHSGISLRLSGFEGGTATNAIPSFCEVTFVCDDIESVERLTQEYAEELRQNFGQDDPGMQVVLESSGDSVEPVSREDSRRIMEFLTLLPCGRRHKSTQVEGFVTASSNLGTIHMAADAVEIGFSMRADTDLKLEILEDEVQILARLLGASYHSEGKTPCWKYQPNSALRAKAAELMPRILGVPLIEEFEHGGLECGYFAQNIPGVDIYVIGPIGQEVHSTKEWMDLESCRRVYGFLVEFLKSLKD